MEDSLVDELLALLLGSGGELVSLGVVASAEAVVSKGVDEDGVW